MEDTTLEDGIRLILGLGNPGACHANTRHNIGWHFLDVLARSLTLDGFTVKNKLCASLVRTSPLTNWPSLMLAKPELYMNHSGTSAANLLRFHKITARQMLVVHDDMDLKTLKVKLKFGGGSGGHNGLKDIIRTVGNGFWRMRIGIGRPALEKVVNTVEAGNRHVLGQFSPNMLEKIEAVASCLDKFLKPMMRGEFQYVMNNINQPNAFDKAFIT